MLTLLLVCSFSPRVHSIPRGPRISRKRSASPGTGVHVAEQRHDEIVQNPRFDDIEKQVELPFNLFLVWWRCGDLNPGSSFYTRHLLHAYSVIKFSYRRSPTDGGFEEAENADLLTAVGKSVARSV